MHKPLDAPPHPAFVAGLACGRQAGGTLPRDTPLSETQRLWLEGFLQGLFGARGEPVRTCAPFVGDPPPPGTAAHVAAPSHHAENPFAARVRSVERIPGLPRPLHRLVVDLEGSRLAYRAGDWLGVFPQNDPDAVRHVLKTLGIRGQDAVETSRGVVPAWRALLEVLDIETVTPDVLDLLARSARTRDEARALARVATAADTPPLDLSALLRRYPSARPTAQELVAKLGPLRPSHYPIASSPAAAPTTIAALACADGTPRRAPPRGVVSAFLAERLQAGEWLPVFVEAGCTLPDDDDAPVVLMGDGLGMAPLLAFLAGRRARGARGRNWLWMEGSAWEPELQELGAARTLTRLERFADPGSARDALRASAEVLWRWIVDNALLVVSGTQTLVTEVERELGALIMTHGRRDALGAADLIASWKRAGRLVTEVFAA